MTNASKAVIIGLVNALIQFVEAFGIYDFTDEQDAALTGLVNAGMLAYVLLTYTRSKKRVPDGMEVKEVYGHQYLGKEG